MKTRFITFLLIFLFILPAFAPWFSHGAIHALHDQHQSHHAANTSANSADRRDRVFDGYKKPTQNIVHHPETLDAVTYFRDYLHSDLQRPDRVVLKAPAQEFQDFDFELAVSFVQQQGYELAFIQERVPPDWQSLRPSHTPLYLSTQRLRI
jgi:hypothetical protein